MPELLGSILNPRRECCPRFGIGPGQRPVRMAVRDMLGCGARRFRVYRRPLGKHSPFVRRETDSLVSLQVTAGQEVPLLQGIPPERSPSRRMTAAQK